MAWHYGFTAFREMVNRGNIHPGDFVKVDNKTYYLTILYRGGKPKYELNDTSSVLNARKALMSKGCGSCRSLIMRCLWLINAFKSISVSIIIDTLHAL